VNNAADDEPVLRAALAQRQIAVTSCRRVLPGIEDVFVSVVSGAQR